MEKISESFAKECFSKHISKYSKSISNNLDTFKGGYLDIKRMNDGTSKATFQITTPKKKFIIAFFQKNCQPSSIEYIDKFLTHLRNNNISGALPLLPYGYTDFGTAFEITPFIEGKSINRPSSKQLRNLGEQFGKLHNSSLNFKYDGNSEKNPNFIRGKVNLAIENAKSYIQESSVANVSYSHNIPSLAKNISCMVKFKAERQNLPSGVIHGDMTRSNVLWEGDNPNPIDFELLHPSNFLYEIGRIILEFIIIPDLESDGRISKQTTDKISTFLNSYHQQRPFTEKEIAVLPHSLQSIAVKTFIRRSGILKDRYPPLPQGVMLQDEVLSLANTNFKSMLNNKLAENDSYPTMNSYALSVR